MKSLLKALFAIPDRIYFLYQLIRFAPQMDGKLTIHGKMYMYSQRAHICFGNNVEINSNLKSNPIGGSTKTILYAKPGARIKIGNNVGISNACLYAAEEIEIGDNVLIGGDTCIYDTDFHSLDAKEREFKKEHIRIVPVRIKDNVFIGAHCLILKGVTIGEKSIIAAGSVVTKDVPSNQIWGGNPAKCIREIGMYEDTLGC